jgi:hypothetical protein
MFIGMKHNTVWSGGSGDSATSIIWVDEEGMSDHTTHNTLLLLWHQLTAYSLSNYVLQKMEFLMS